MTKRSIYILVCSSLFVMMSMPIYSQLFGDGRVHLAQLNTNSELIIQISVPRGQTIESAVLNVESQAFDLSPSPVNLDLTQWLVIDSAANIVNLAPAIQTGLLRFIQGIDQSTQVGIIFVANELTIFQPTSNVGELIDIINTYTASAGDISCMADALNYLGTSDFSGERGLNILVVSGERTRQSLCVADEVTDFIAPIDIIYTSDNDTDWYLNIVEQTQGELKRTNIQTIETRINEIKSIWVAPVFNITGNIEANSIEDGQIGKIKLVLSNDDNLTLPLRIDVKESVGLEIVTLLATVDSPPPTPVATITLTVPTIIPSIEPTLISATDTIVQVEPTVQILPTETLAEDSQVIVSEPNLIATDSPTLPPPPTIVPTVVEVIEQATSQSVSETSIPITDNTSETTEIEITSIPATDDKIDAQVVEPSISASPTDVPDETDQQPLSSETDIITRLYSQLPIDLQELIPVEAFPFVLGGIVILFLLIILVLLKMIGRLFFRGQRQSSPSGNPDLNRTMLEDSAALNTTVLEVTEKSDNLDWTMLGDEEEDPLDRTQLVTEDEFLKSTNQLIMGYLTNNQTQEIYEIQRPITTLGRSSDNGIIIDDQSISRQHLRFFSEDHAVWMEILTGNPVSYNNELTKGQIKLTNNDILQISPKHQFIFTEHDPSNNS